MEADGIYYGPGGWQKDVERWRQFGDDRPYHYLGSPWFFAQVGTSFGKTMLEVLSNSTSSRFRTRIESSPTAFDCRGVGAFFGPV